MVLYKRKSGIARQRERRIKTKPVISETLLAGIGQKVKLSVHAKASRKPRLLMLPGGESSTVVYARCHDHDRAYPWAFLIHSYQLQNFALALEPDDVIKVTGVLVTGDGIHNTLNVETLDRMVTNQPLASLPAWQVLR